ncbi:MAG: calcium/sodium antiporter [Microscillaceae bacterium]|jgi:cation:H+ antiporter|nr:calcium/sodium antiporter [Microscillaceae bacterium]
MELLWNILLIAIGVGITVIGSTILVDGASDVAKKFGIPDLIIGLTVVAFGTSSPELAVNINASLAGDTAIAIGNCLGSNIFNVFIILGISAVVYPISIQSNSVWIEVPLSLLAALMVGVCANDIYFDGYAKNELTRTDGLAFMGFFAVFMYYTVYTSKTAPANDQFAQEMETEMKNQPSMPAWKSMAFIVGGLVCLYFGSEWLVEGSKAIAKVAGLSDAIIGLTIVAAGTSVPELATSITAALKKNSDIAIGNVVGSNIFNIFFILGTSAMINPLPFVSATATIDILMTIFSSVIVFLFAFTGRNRNVISRIEGIVLISIYLVYVGYLISQV